MNESESPKPPCTTPVVVKNAPRLARIEDIPHAILPPDYTLRDLERTMEYPARDRGNFAVLTAEGFNRQVALLRKPINFVFGTAGSTSKRRKPTADVAIADANPHAQPIWDPMPIYFQRQNNSAVIQAVLNSSDWRDHTVTLSQKLSEPFQEWLKGNTVGQAQRAFALFLEERTHHVVKPDGAKLLELARKFKATTNVRFASVVDAGENGDGALEYIQTTQAGQADARNSMKVPERITLGMPIWHGGDPVRFEARFGYAITEGRLSLSYEILGLNELLSDTLRGLVDKIGSEHPRSVLIEGENARVLPLNGS